MSMACALSIGAAAHATSQGPVADGPYVGTLPCADCAGIRTTLTLYTMGEGGAPLAYRMTATYLGTREGDRTEERLGPWARVGTGADAIVRLEPYRETIRQSLRRANADTLVLLDRDEKPIATTMDLRLRRDATATAAR
ncbi:MAG: copper resistance protein NlpE N-terminal domain-containing protein, partial [Rubrivivax sp.]|nr:copper resistance protein NlpE N-terminal domain-containing protein [Rubrivivax sp.]